MFSFHIRKTLNLSKSLGLFHLFWRGMISKKLFIMHFFSIEFLIDLLFRAFATRFSFDFFSPIKNLWIFRACLVTGEESSLEDFLVLQNQTFIVFHVWLAQWNQRWFLQIHVWWAYQNVQKKKKNLWKALFNRK